MQKTHKRSEGSEVRQQRRSRPSFPEEVTIDVLGTMTDEDLGARRAALEIDMEAAFNFHIESRPWEVELAYLRREQQIRRSRRENHSSYLRKLEEEFSQSEVGLPNGDFDNYAFVYAATGGRPRWN